MNKIISAIVALFIVFAVPTAAGCTWFKHEETIVKNDVIDCAHQDLGQTVKDMGMSLLFAVVAIVAQGGADWKADLGALEAKYGPDALACASKIASDLFKGFAPPSPTPSTGERAESPYDRASQALQTYALGKNFK